ncbi:MAG: hypothetical protein ACLVJO_02785 [[Clostridium] scindens]
MVVLGGVSLSGGKGSVSGTLLGIILVALLSNGMILVGVSTTGRIWSSDRSS